MAQSHSKHSQYNPFDHLANADRGDNRVPTASTRRCAREILDTLATVRRLNYGTYSGTLYIYLEIGEDTDVAARAIEGILSSHLTEYDVVGKQCTSLVEATPQFERETPRVESDVEPTEIDSSF